MELAIPLLVAAAAVLFLGLGAILDDRRARMRRWAEEEGEAVEAVLPLLHSINDDRCIGCEACIDACPTEVLDLVDHKVKVERFGDCVQCEQCANACPTQALVMYREGTTPRMLTVPELDDHFQTAVPGQYLIGEVAGKPLVKNAANLGRAVIEQIARDLAGRPAAPKDVLDVVIVGSGPGGLSAGLTCLKRKMSFLVLEKEHIISSTVSRYPKGKHFMAEPCSAQNVSFLPVFDATKEELVASWQKVVDEVKMPIRLGEAVDKVTRGDDGIFQVKTTVATYKARTVVLATGLRGKPRLLAVPGANLEKVAALLDDPEEFAGQDVLVVGGGDSAVEGAMSLVDAGARVTLSYRGDGFKRCKQGNQKRLAELVASQRVTLHLESNVTQFTEREVSLKLKDGQVVTQPNQRAFVLIGADTPVAWLEANNVRFVERPHLYALGSTEDAVRKIVPEAAECPRDPAEAVALVLGRPVHKSATQRARSVVEHLVDDLFDVVTSVSGAFHLSSVEDVRRHGRAATEAHPLSPALAAKGLQVGEQIIPAANLLGRSTGTVTALGHRTEPVAALGRRTEPVAALGRRTEPVAALGRKTASGAALGHGAGVRPMVRRPSTGIPTSDRDTAPARIIDHGYATSPAPSRHAAAPRASGAAGPSPGLYGQRSPVAPPTGASPRSARPSVPAPSRPSPPARPSVPAPARPSALSGAEPTKVARRPLAPVQPSPSFASATEFEESEHTALEDPRQWIETQAR